MITNFIKQNKFIVTVAVLWLVVAIFVSFLPIDKLISNVLYDDAFYYFQVARNIARGAGVTFDSIHVTNGFHPLWMAVSVGAYKLVGANDSVMPIRMLLILSSLFSCASLVLFWRILMLFGKNNIFKKTVFLLLAFNPYFFYESLNGLETALNVLLILTLLYVVLRLACYSKINGRESFYFGFVAGLVLLIRTDHIFLVVATIIFLFIYKKLSYKNLLIVCATISILGMPWIIWNYATFGTIVQGSGQAYKYVTQSITILDKGSTWGFVEGIKTVALMTYEGFVGVGRLLGFVGIIYLLTGLVAGLFMKNYQSLKNNLSEYNVALKFFATAFALYFFVHCSLRWTGRTWYFVPVIIFILIVIDYYFSKYGGSDLRFLKTICLGVLAVSVFVFVFEFKYGLYNRMMSQKTMLEAANYIKNSPNDLRFGAFNAGVTGYFSDRNLVNLDGLINNSAYEALKRHDMYEYLKENGINYIVDNSRTIDYRYKSFMGRRMEDVLVKERSFDVPGVKESFSFSLYRVKY